MQAKLDNTQMAERARGIVKAAILEGDPEAKNLLAISIYDNKPVYIVYTVLHRVIWQVKDKKVYNRSTRKMYAMK